MNSLDTLSGALLGLFFITVGIKGNSKKMIELAKRDKAFLKWALAVAILGYLYNQKYLHKTMGYLIAIAFLGLFITNIDKISESTKSLWNLLD